MAVAACAKGCKTLALVGLLWLAMSISNAVETSDIRSDEDLASEGGDEVTSSSPQDFVAGMRFDVEPVDTVVLRGDDVTLNCSVSTDVDAVGPDGEPFIELSWRKDGEPISNGDARRTVFPDGRLLIEKVQMRAVIGVYECIATSPDGVLVSRPASLDIAKLGRFTSQPEPMVVMEGQTAGFQCEIGGTPKPTISWEKNNEPISTSERLIVLPTGVLLIENARVDDAGVYRCRASNIARDRHSKNATLQVNAADSATKNASGPELIIEPENTQVPAGESVVLECAAVTYSGPSGSSITWRRLDDKPIPANRSRVIGRASLQILNVSSDDEGWYQCFFEDFPDVWAKAMINVLVPPRIVRPLRNMIRQRIGNVRLTCDATGSPVPEITWMKDGLTIESDKHIQVRGNVLVIKRAVEADAGIFQCWAVNEAGRVGSAMHLAIEIRDDPPDPPTGLKAVSVSARAVELSWDESPPKNGQPIVAYAVHYKANRAGAGPVQSVVQKTWARIEPLIPYTYYSFYVVAYSGRDPSDLSPVITLRTEEDVPVGVPEVKLSLASPTSMMVSWSRLSSEHARGLITRHEIRYRRQYSDIMETIEVPGDEYEHVIADLEDGVRYEVIVFSGTEMGFPPVDSGWPWSSLVIGELQQSEVPIGVPEVNLRVAGPNSMAVSWSRLSSKVARGEITQHEIWYRPQHSDDVPTVIEVPGNVYEQVIAGLDTGVEYEVMVLSGTEMGFPPMSDEWPWSSLVVGELHRSDLTPNVNISSGLVVVRSPTEIELTWDMVSETDIVAYGLIAYKITYRSIDSGDTSREREIMVMLRDTEHRITNLVPNTMYEVSLSVATVSHFGPRTTWTIRTLPSLDDVLPQEVPDRPVQLHAEALNETAIRLMWKEPTGSAVAVSYYNVSCRHSEADMNSYLPAMFMTSLETRVVISGLEPFTVYYLAVCGGSSVRQACGSFSEEITCRTAEGRPSSPRELNLTLIGPVEAHVSWLPPLRPNGLLSSYIISVCEHRMDASSSITMATTESCTQLLEKGSSNHTILRSLRPSTMYRVRVQAVTVLGQGPPTEFGLITTRWDYYTGPGPVKGDINNDRLMGIVIGVSISGCCIIICIVIILLRNRCAAVSHGSDLTKYACCSPPGHHHHHFHSNGCICRDTPVMQDDINGMTSLNHNHSLTRPAHIVGSKGCIHNSCCCSLNGTPIHEIARHNSIYNTYVQTTNGLTTSNVIICTCTPQTASRPSLHAPDLHQNLQHHQLHQHRLQCAAVRCQDLQSNEDTDVEGSDSLGSANT